jgi:hypothetical protein|tara:strand:- start:1255 stop:1605 length:351 start_codon:yes stop_codon:yes gene_type:complete
MSELETKSLEILKERLIGTDIVVGNIMKIVRFAMEVVEVTELKGEAQKDLSIVLIQQVIVDAPITDEKEKLLLDMIESGILGSTIDFVVAATKGELGLNGILNTAVGCCTTFLKKL